jgi:hypothetical protein
MKVEKLSPEGQATHGKAARSPRRRRSKNTIYDWRLGNRMEFVPNKPKKRNRRA